MPILDWLDREQDVKAADAVPYRLLEPVDNLSCGDPASPNMLIQGDNLEALKSLLPYYSGQVKCIFIDPPYTRSAFEHYDDNLEHSQWLSMMYSSTLASRMASLGHRVLSETLTRLYLPGSCKFVGRG